MMWVRRSFTIHFLSSVVIGSIYLVSSLTTGSRVEEAMTRSVRWLDRCIAQHERSGKKDSQNLFAIVQGGLDPSLRDRCLDAMIDRRDAVAGYAIGGLSGGEEKGSYQMINTHPLSNKVFFFFPDVFWRMCVLYIHPTNLSQVITESSNVPINFPKTVCTLHASPDESQSDYEQGPVTQWE
jgi:hypothetical protein